MLIYLLHISSNPTMVTFLIDLEGLLVYALSAICLFSNFSSYFGHVSSVIVLENGNLLYSRSSSFVNKQQNKWQLEMSKLVEKTNVEMKFNRINLVFATLMAFHSQYWNWFNLIGYIMDQTVNPGNCSLQLGMHVVMFFQCRVELIFYMIG